MRLLIEAIVYDCTVTMSWMFHSAFVIAYPRLNRPVRSPSSYSGMMGNLLTYALLSLLCDSSGRRLPRDQAKLSVDENRACDLNLLSQLLDAQVDLDKKKKYGLIWKQNVEISFTRNHRFEFSRLRW